MATLQSAREHHQRSLLLSRRAIAQARDARNRSTVDVAASVILHQATAAQLGERAIAQMLIEQDIDAAAAALLDSTAFTTETDRLIAMIEQTETDYEFNRLIGTLVTDAGNSAEGVAIAVQSRVGWVRQVTPPCCKRCAVLAGRFYRWSDGFERHPNCRCTHIATTEREAAERGLVLSLEDLHEQGLVSDFTQAELEAIALGADINDVVNIRRLAGDLQVSGRVLRRRDRLTPEGVFAQAEGDQDRAIELLGENGYLRSDRSSTPTKTATGGANPPAPPRQPPTPSAPSPEPDPIDWVARQAALGIETNGETLKPAEVQFVERFLELGESIEWIATGSNGRNAKSEIRSTNDFIWLSNGGLLIELKSPQRAAYSPIKTLISDAVREARENHQVVKGNFIVDLGNKVLTEKLRRQLSLYNVRNRASGNEIAAMWVLSQGVLTQIEQQ